MQLGSAMLFCSRRSPAIGLHLENAIGVLFLADLPTPVLQLILSYTGSGLANLDGIRVTKDELLQEHTLLCWHLWVRIPALDGVRFNEKQVRVLLP